MLNEIVTHIFQATGQRLINPHQQPVSGGSINQAFCLSDRSNKFFVKTNTAPRLGMFEAEAIALNQIYNTHTIQVPKPICWGITDGFSYIVTEWIEFGRNGNWSQLGQNLAALHRVTTSSGFGWDQQNTIGATPQINHWTSNWVDFFIEHRLLYQIKLARQKGLQVIASDQELWQLVPPLFQGYNPQPSLVHGDLWSGNMGFDQLGTPVIFDPALYFGDREVDLAMTELFGGFPSQFYQGYNQVFPLDSGYQSRKTLYNLYHILNHFNLFGGSYGSTAQGMIKEIKG
ncbi:fructosamine-3-kinase [Synechococcus sp. PCC 7502]|uniref:fructosamine kinase family protein n=1 Tax=Synechococcus sp. PCC 7502 TaxID=1173263 RepID=UPI00029FF2CC|nr:fructosamine kinase family protein [Synechococcus sp. PCC 7502]AFY74655.1 fructosamine-3-kinase [Synechococcus sp. PCC 7502]